MSQSRETDDLRHNVTFELVETGIDFTVVQLPGTLTDRLEQKRLGIQFGVDTENVKDDPGSCAIVASTDDVSVANEEHELSLVIIIESGEGVDRTT